jgi:hypothetical protein
LVNAASITVGWSGQLAETRGGTNQSTYTLGDTLYASAANTLAKLSGNTTGTRKFLQQTGTGAVSASPVWDTILAADVPGSALTRTSDTNVTLTLGGSPSTALLNAASITAGWTGQLAVGRGGTGLSTIAANRIPYASALDTLATSAGLTFDGTTLAVTGFNNTGNTTLGDASADTLTINSGTWTIGSTVTATRAMGAAAAGTTNALEWDTTFTGDAGGTSNVRGANFQITGSGGNAVSAIRSVLGGATWSGTATLTTMLGFNATVSLTSTGSATTADVFRAGSPTLSSTGVATALTAFHANNQGNATLVGTARGFLADDQTASATAAYGFESQVTAASGKLSFYDSGGAGIQGAGKIVSTSATAGIGYAAGAGGTQTQGTSKATGVTLNTITGKITTFNDALAARGIATFTVACTAVLAATDTAILQHESGGTVGAYTLRAGTFVAGTSFNITITNNSAGSLSEALVIRYVIIRSVDA